jgi:hypothetical protein
MESYIYISDAQVDTLLAQAHNERTIVRRLKRKVYGDVAKQKEVGSPRSIEERIRRLKIAEHYLQSKRAIGPRESPKSWVADQMLMRWGIIEVPSTVAEITRISDIASHFVPIVWFSGTRGAHDIVALGGSQNCLVESAEARDSSQLTWTSSTIGSSISILIYFYGSAGPEYALNSDDETTRSLMGPDFSPSAWHERLINAAVAMNHSWGGSEYHLRFVAKRLVSGSSSQPLQKSYQVTVGEPLYVSRA